MPEFIKKSMRNKVDSKEDVEMMEATREINTYIGKGGIVPSIRNQISVSTLRAPELKGPINTFTTTSLSGRCYPHVFPYNERCPLDKMENFPKER